MWPGIPTGRGSTCIEEGCGNDRRARGNDCRKCYDRKRKAHKRAGHDDPNSWGLGGYEVPFSRSTRSELDARSYSEWRATQDEYA